MAESTRANIFNVDAVKAAYGSVIGLLARLETVEHKRKAIKCLYDQLSCAASILESFTVAFDNQGPVNLALKLSINFEQRFRASKTPVQDTRRRSRREESTRLMTLYTT